ncbi:right-handed parallel beta-helix repeat-containing protein [Mucilaginibacter defluvii]|uniref:Right handed beta helix domain-containing protein n=1 Tax=Mucilaginibacter defluvii TaxID=1196019 RepID=A0ABP9FPS7_9SPHI
MKHKIFAIKYLFLLAASTPAFAQSTYYVSADGNDANAGTSTNAPIKSIDKANQLILKPGDVLSFKKGDVFSGQLNIKQSGTSAAPITVSSYGSGSKPVIDGSVAVTGWKRSSGNIWVASLNAYNGSAINLFANNQPLPLGRYPNSGYLIIRSHSGKTQLTSKQSLNGNWTGADVVIRKNLWQIDTDKIISQQGNTLTFKGTPTAMNDNWGFFIQDHPKTLDRDGEWYFNPSTKQIMLYSLADPGSKNIEASIYTAGINIVGQSNIVIKDIAIAEQRQFGINGKNLKGLAVKNVTISDVGQDGISILGRGNNVIIDGCTISDINNNAVVVYDHSGFRFRNNTIKNIGLVVGRGTNSSGSFVGLRYNAKAGSAIIQNNTIENVGYSGIDFRSANVTIQNNLIKNINLTKSDGGGIYTYSGKNPNNYTNQKIVSNIILNSVGSYDGSYNANQNAHGIYLDDRSHDIDIQNNTIANCTGSGIFLNGASRINIQNNTCYGNGTQLLVSTTPGADPVNNTILSNILVGKKKQVMSLNRSRLLRTAVSLANSNKQLQDISDDAARFEYNASGSPKTINLNGTYKDANNKTYTGKVTLQPFSSIVLTK